MKHSGDLSAVDNSAFMGDNPRTSRGRKRLTLGIDFVQHAREWDGFTDMLKATNPCDRALDAHAESCVGNRTERSQIQIPFKGVFRKAVFLEPRFKLVALMDPLSASDDFTIAFRREDIHAERQRGILGIFLHVKGLNDLWIAMDYHRPVEFLR